MAFLKHSNSSSPFKAPEAQTSAKHQRLCGSYLSNYDLQIENSARRSNRRTGQIVSFRQRLVEPELQVRSQSEPTFKKRGGSSNLKGQLCKVQLATLFLLQGLIEKTDGKIHGFHLATNMEEAGDFKDVVFKYKYWCQLAKNQVKTEKSRIIFLHSMHVNNTESNKFTIDVFSSDPRKKLVADLQSHFSSYRAIKQHFEEQRQHPMFGGSFEDSSFVIYTNALPAFSDGESIFKQPSKYFERILHTGGASISGHCYKMVVDCNVGKMGEKVDSRIKANQKIVDTLKQASECRKLAKELVKSVFQCEEGKSPEIKHQGILKKYHIPLSETVVIKSSKGAKVGKFSSVFINGDESLLQQDVNFRNEFFEEAKTFTGKSEIELERELESKTVKLSKKFGDDVDPGEDSVSFSLPTDHVHDNEIREFLSKLQFHIAMPSEDELAEIVKEKAKDFFSVDQEDIDTIYSDVKVKVENWWKAKNYYLTENNRFFHDSIRISVCFDLKRPVEMFTGRKKELEHLHSVIHDMEERAAVPQMTVVTGLGGIGKTELLRQYVYKRSKDYDNNVIWIKAESYGTMVDSFCRLAQNVMKVRIKNSDGSEKDIRSIVEEVHRYFCKRKCLFIFDNAEQYKTQDDTDPGIDKFLPPLSQNGKTFIVVTSRSQDWGNVKTLPLDVFSKEDAEEFIRTALNVQQELQEGEIWELSEALHRFPLALQQAVAYIKEEDTNLSNKGEKFSIGGYLEEYKKEGKKMKELLGFQLSGKNDYDKTTLITWKISLQKIQTLNYGDEALDILQIIAYFAPDGICTKIFLERITERRVLASALQLLKQYSMISIDSGEAKIHRLLQQVIRESLKTQQREKGVLTNAMELLRNVLEGGDEIRYDCTPHAMSTWTFASKYEDLVKKFSEVPLNIMLELDRKGIVREEAYLFMRNASQILESVLGTGHIDTLLTLNAVAVVCEHRGKYNEAIGFYRDVHNKLLHALSSDHPLALVLQSNVARALRNQGKYDEATKICQEVLEQRRQILGDGHPDTLFTLNESATILANQGKYDKALNSYQEVLEKMEQILGADDREILTLKHDMAVAYYHQGRYDEAISIYEEVLKKQNEMLGPNHPDSLRTQNNMSLIFCAKGQYDEALSSCEELMDKEEQVLGPDNVQSFILQLCRARVLYEKGSYAEALVICQELLNQKGELLGPDHPDILQTNDIKAAVLLEQGNYDEALHAYNELLDRKLRVFGCDSLLTLKTKNNIATVLAMQGKYDEALLTYKESLDKYELLFGSDDLGILTTEHDIAGVLVDQGHYYEALEIYQKVLNKFQDILEPDHLDILTVKQNIASVLTKLGKYDAALSTYVEVLDRKRNTVEPDHPSTLLTHMNMTAVLHKQGKYDKALLNYQELLQVFNQMNPNHPYKWIILSNMGSVLQDKGYYDMALKLHQMVLDKRKEILDSGHHDVLTEEEFIATVFFRQGKYDMALKMFSQVLDKRKNSLGLNHPESLRSLQNVAAILERKGNYQESLETYQEIQRRWKLILGEDHPDALVTQCSVARVLFNLGKYRESLNSYRAILDKKKRILGLLHPSTLETQHNFGRALLQQGKYSDAEKTFNEVLNKRKGILGPGHPDTLDVLDDIADVFFSRGYYDLSLKAYEEALHERKRFLGPKHPDTLQAQRNVAGVLFSQERYTDSLKVYSEVFDKMKKIWGSSHPSTLHSWNDMATVMRAQENYEESMKVYKEVLEKRKQVLGPTHPDTLSTLSCMARVMCDQRHFDLSLEAHRDVLSKRKRILGGPDHPDTLRTENDIAEVFLKQENYEMALEVSRKLIDKTVRIFGPESRYILIAQNRAAVSLDGAGKYEQALEAYNDLLNKSEQILGSDHPRTLSVMDDVAAVLYKLGNYDEALKLSQEVLEKKEQRLGSRHPSTLFTMERVTRGLGDAEGYFAVIKTCVEVLDKEQILALYNSDPLTAGYMVLHTLCRECELHVLSHLLENGADVFARNDDHTLVHQAATNNDSAVVKLILNKIKEKCGNMTPYIDEADDEGDTPLMWAAQTGNVGSARVLLECGANINAKNKSGQTALHWAAKGGFKDIVELLLYNEIDPEIKDVSDATALDLAYDKFECGEMDEESFKSVTSLLLTVSQETPPTK